MLLVTYENGHLMQMKMELSLGYGIGQHTAYTYSIQHSNCTPEEEQLLY